MIYTQDEIENLEASAIDREKLVLEVNSLKKENEGLRELLRTAWFSMESGDSEDYKKWVIKYEALLEKDKV